MTIIEDYNQFGSVHWETGSVRNVLAQQNIIAPHSGEAFSEAMLLGLSGGISVLYFVFEYEGQPPHVYVGTRLASPEDEPLSSLYKRLGITTYIDQTTSASKAVAQLGSALAAGKPAIVWADAHGLPYNVALKQPGPLMLPIIVYGYDEAVNEAHIADRARTPLTTTTGELAAARGAQASVKHRMMTLEAPQQFDDLPGAVRESLARCSYVMLNGPGKGPKTNWGLAALQKWADLMVDAKDKKGWSRLFPPGAGLYDALCGVFANIEINGTGGGASRAQYADFLDEAADIVARPALRDVAQQFRGSAELWSALAQALLPDEIAQFAETRELLMRKHTLFIEQGMAAMDEMRQIKARLEAIRAELAADFPLGEDETARLREAIRERIGWIYDAEQAAVLALEAAMA